MTARLAELVKQVDTGESGQIWNELKEAADEFQQAQREQDKNALNEALQEIIRLIRRGSGEYMTWQEIRSTVLDRDRIIASERKRLLEAQAYFTAEQGMAMLMRIAESVKTHVKDEKAIRAIANDIYLVMNFQGTQVDVNPE